MKAQPRAWRLALLAGFLLVPGISPSAQASTAREELLRLVPDDVGLCLIVNDLRGQTNKLLAAPWMKRLQGTALAQTLVSSPEIGKINKVDEVLRQALNVSLSQVIDDILGDAVVFAYRLGPVGKSDQEQGLLLLRARDAALLARLVNALNREQKRSGELKALDYRDYNGVRYFRRQDNRGEHFYYLSGPLLAFANQESMLRQVIDRNKVAKTSRAAEGLRGTEAALVSLWVNPRAYDEDLRAKAAKAEGPESRVLEAFRSCWQALDGINLALGLGKNLELRLTLKGRPEALPPAFRRLVESETQPSELWARFPRDAGLTAVGRVDFAALEKALAEVMTPEARQALHQALKQNLGAALGLDVFKDVLPRLGPDVGLCVTPAADPAHFPHVLFALRMRPGPKEAPVDQAVYRAVQFFAGLAVFEHNRTHKNYLRLRTLRQGQVEVKCLSGEGALMPGLEPAFALKEGFLVLASSPAAIEHFAAGPVSAASGKETPILRISFPVVCSYLKARRQALVSFFAEKDQRSPEVIGTWLDSVVEVLSLADQLELTQQSHPGQATWTLRLRMRE
jgi:hypothetical protein